jgi:hypothetical protein
LGVKAKEDFANALVRILHVERRAPEALAELAMAEVLSQENGTELAKRGKNVYATYFQTIFSFVAIHWPQKRWKPI